MDAEDEEERNLIKKINSICVKSAMVLEKIHKSAENLDFIGMYKVSVFDL